MSGLQRLLLSFCLTSCTVAVAGPVIVLKGGGVALDSGPSAIELRADSDAAFLAIRECRTSSLVVEGVRSPSEPGTAWSIYLTRSDDTRRLHKTHPGYVGQVSFFGTTGAKGDGRKVSYPLSFDVRALIGKASSYQEARLTLRFVPVKQPEAASRPQIRSVTLWCSP
jgi:hypothetical protein